MARTSTTGPGTGPSTGPDIDTDTGTDTGINTVVVRGRLSSAPRERALPSGSALVEVDVSIRAGGSTASVPVVWFDPPRRAGIGPDTPVGTEVVVTGQVRRRWFRAGGVTQSRTEVVADAVVLARRARECERAVARAIDALVAAGG